MKITFAANRVSTVRPSSMHTPLSKKSLGAPGRVASETS